MSPGEQFIQDVLEGLGTPAARMAFLSRVAKYSGRAIYIPASSKAARRVQAAVRMLENLMPEREIAVAIHDRFGVTERQARRDIKTARQAST